MKKQKTAIDPNAVPVLVPDTAATADASINLLPLDPARAAYYQGKLTGLSVQLVQTQLEMVGEMETNLGVIKQGLQGRLTRLLPQTDGRRPAPPPGDAAAVLKTPRSQSPPGRKKTAVAKPAAGRTRRAKADKPAQVPSATEVNLREGSKLKLLFDKIDGCDGKGIARAELIDFAYRNKKYNPDSETREVIAGRVSSDLTVLARKDLIESVDGAWHSKTAPTTATAKPAKGEKGAAPKGKPAQAAQTTEVPLREGSQQHVLYTEIDRHGAEGIANAKTVDFATKNKVINPDGETREVIARRVSAMLSVLAKKKLISNIGASRLQGVWASTANLTGSVVKPAPPRKATRSGQGQPREGKRLATAGQKLPREGTKARVLLDEVIRRGDKGITQAAAAEFAHKNKAINSDGAALAVINTRVAAMFQSLRTAGLVENVDNVWYWKGTTLGEAKPTPPPRPTDPKKPVHSSNRAELRQAFLNSFLHGKKRGTFADQIRKEVQRREQAGSNDTGFDPTDKDDLELCREITQYLVMSRHNFAGDGKLPQKWWVNGEAPHPFCERPEIDLKSLVQPGSPQAIVPVIPRLIALCSYELTREQLEQAIKQFAPELGYDLSAVPRNNITRAFQLALDGPSCPFYTDENGVIKPVEEITEAEPQKRREKRKSPAIEQRLIETDEDVEAAVLETIKDAGVFTEDLPEHLLDNRGSPSWVFAADEADDDILAKVAKALESLEHKGQIKMDLEEVGWRTAA